MIKEISIKSAARNELIDITSGVSEAVSESGVKEGMCLVYVPHTTAAVTINENADPSVKKDLLKKLSSLVPEKEGYSHTEGNSDAHIKSSLIGCSLLIPVRGSALTLGTWQGILFCEFDGPRSRRVLVHTIGSK
jgi:secondary thiamine-phosphate synthase enzyme